MNEYIEEVNAKVSKIRKDEKIRRRKKIER